MQCLVYRQNLLHHVQHPGFSHFRATNRYLPMREDISFCACPMAFHFLAELVPAPNKAPLRLFKSIYPVSPILPDIDCGYYLFIVIFLGCVKMEGSIPFKAIRPSSSPCWGKIDLLQETGRCIYVFFLGPSIQNILFCLKHAPKQAKMLLPPFQSSR